MVSTAEVFTRDGQYGPQRRHSRFARGKALCGSELFAEFEDVKRGNRF